MDCLSAVTNRKEQKLRKQKRVGDSPINKGTRLVILIQGATNVPSVLNSVPNTYAKIYCNDRTVGKTEKIKETNNPMWDTKFEELLLENETTITLKVFDFDGNKKQLIGKTSLKVEDLLKDSELQRRMPLSDDDGEEIKNSDNPCFISFTLKLVLNRDWTVPETQFPARENCFFEMYQSAHVDEFDPIPEVYNSETGRVEKNIVTKGTWEEIYRKIYLAKVFIYITGWSVNTNISLLRRKVPKELGHDKPLTIGELLKLKADQGVTVIVNVWDPADSISTSSGTVITDGVLDTHDEETFHYFQGTKVHCVLSNRDSKGFVDKIWSSFVFSHHQKTVMVDDDFDEYVSPDKDKLNILDPETETPKPDDYETPSPRPECFSLKKRRVIAFIGGIDLCDGRWDTPSKNLFQTLSKEHQGDFHNLWKGVKSEFGPRQPWQDIHSKVVGKVARDIVINFEQRLQKQHKDSCVYLLNLEDHPMIINSNDDVYSKEDRFTSQLFRSIDSTSAIGVDHGFEKSIQLAYINAIRMAKNFIYIENQFFMGSSNYWFPPKKGCENAIPIELCNKIIEKIRNNEEFCVFIVIPLYPEGYPKELVFQQLLYQQSSTINMMYVRIFDELKKKSSNKSVYDYLNFYCLGNREPLKEEKVKLRKRDKSKNQVKLLHSRRYQIYVHSKMMIVDDEYAIVGSANINERSLSGDRDTEIAVGCYQPVLKDKGAIHQFRMSLWGEHFGFSCAEFVHPQKVSTVKMINEKASINWNLFNGRHVRPVNGHILKYPLEIKDNGTYFVINKHPKHHKKYIPDTHAPVIGKNNVMIPEQVTM